jgi:hypothetical protein
MSCGASPCASARSGAEEGNPPPGDHDAASEFGNRRPPIPQEIDPARSLGPPSPGEFTTFKRPAFCLLHRFRKHRQSFSAARCKGLRDIEAWSGLGV